MNHSGQDSYKCACSVSYMLDVDRIPLVESREDLKSEDQHHYDEISESRGGVRGPFRVLLNSPELAGRIGHLGAYIRYEGRLPDDVRELAIISTARAFDCAFEWAAHEPIARDAGVSGETIEAVARGGPVEELSRSDQLVVSLARQLFRDNRVKRNTYDAAHEKFGDAGVVELVVTMGYYGMIASVLNTFEILPDADRPSLPDL